MALGARGVVVALGVGGVLPFAGATFAGLGGFFEPGFARTVLVAYGAVILAFLGAVHWGLALASPDHPATTSRLGLGVLPALVGWVALLLPRGMGLLVLVAGFLAVWAAEEIAARQGLLPGLGYLWLRRGLTLAVVTCLSAALLATGPVAE